MLNEVAHELFLASLPSRGAWIEMSTSMAWSLKGTRVAPLTGSVDRNQMGPVLRVGVDASLPSRGAWIEITARCASAAASWVAPLAGSVDRNQQSRAGLADFQVAPLAGSVDRNGPVEADDSTVRSRSPRGERG